MRESLPWRHRRPSTLANPDASPALDYVLTSEPEEPRFRDYWRMMRNHWRLIIVVFLTVVALGLVITAQTTPLYTASTTLRIEPQNPSVMGAGEVFPKGDEYFQTQVTLIKSRALAARVIKDLRLDRHPNFVVSRHPIDRLIGWVIGNIEAALARAVDFFKAAPPPSQGLSSAQEAEFSVDPRYISGYLSLLTVDAVPKTRLVKVSFNTIDPSFSEQLARVHATTYIRMNLETRFELTKEAREFLERKLAEFKVKVSQSEEALNHFRKQRGVVSLEGNENIVVERMVDLNRRLTEARAKRIELESLSRIIKDKNLTSLSQIIDNNVIVQLRGRLESLEAEHARLSTIFKANHPRLQELEEQIGQARKRLELETRKVVRAIESDYAAARAKEAALQSEAERQQQSALDLKELGVQYTLLQGEFEANRTVYANVAKRLSETSITTDSPLSNIQIVEPAEIPLSPSSPKLGRNLLLASGLGLLLGVGLALLLEYANAALGTPEEVWRAVAIPTLGAVPHWRSLRRQEYWYKHLPQHSPLRRLAPADAEEKRALSTALIASHHPFSFISEAYRTIRSGLLLAQTEQPLQVILLTSARPGEGKTSVALNLAITLAQSGRRVAVIDADLRAGNCHAMLGRRNRQGLVDVLTNGTPLDVALQSTAIDGFYFIARGAIPPNPTDLLGSDRMKDVIHDLRGSFDFVLIDSPPAVAVSDAMVLSVQCDGVLLVLRARRTPAEAVQRVVDRLGAVGARILGMVLVGVDLRHPDYAEYRHYYASYYTTMRKGTKQS